MVTLVISPFRHAVKHVANLLLLNIKNIPPNLKRNKTVAKCNSLYTNSKNIIHIIQGIMSCLKHANEQLCIELQLEQIKNNIK